MVDVKHSSWGIRYCNSELTREKCRVIKLTFPTGILYENIAANNSLEIRQFIPTREKRISFYRTCLFRSLSYIITGTDYNHKEIRELITLANRIFLAYMVRPFLGYIGVAEF